MHADTATIVGLITPVNVRFVVPVYQRPYTWDARQCAQLWEDIVSIGRAAEQVTQRSLYGGSHEAPAYHFTGSIVWIQDGSVSARGVTPRLLIDGQQRITTLMLIFIALVRYAQRHRDRADRLLFSAEEILDDGYLTNKHRGGADHYKLTLAKGDRDTFISLIDALEDPTVPLVGTSQHLVDNLALFEGWLEELPDPTIVWRGIQQLQVASIALTEGQDNPQLVFESMNSTGKDLSTADLVRNFILMSCPLESQTSLYRSFWQPIEEALSVDTHPEQFDAFLHDWLCCIRAPEIPNAADVYAAFKRSVRIGGYDTGSSIIALVNQLRRFVRYYAHIVDGKVMSGVESFPELDDALGALRALGEKRVNPLILFLYDAYDQQDIDRGTFIKLLRIFEAYILRRTVCNCPSEGLATYISSLIRRLGGIRAVGGDVCIACASYLLNREDTPLRFPTDEEFRRALALHTSVDWPAGTAIGDAVRLHDTALDRWPLPHVDEAMRKVFRGHH